MSQPQGARADAAFTGLVERVEARLIGYLRFTLGSGDDAEDLFQETMIATHGNWGTVKKMDSPEAWVFRVARNLALNRSKRRGTERRVLSSITPGSAEPADARVQLTETQQRIQAALDSLPHNEKEAVCLKIWAGCSWVEISRLLDVSEDAAARLFARGLKAISPALADLAPEVKP